MPNHAHATLAGHLGGDAQTRHLSDGKQVTNFSLAVSTGWGDRKTSTWWRVTIWGKPAEWAAELKKGDAVLVAGEPSMREYEHDGVKKQSLEVNANSFFKIPKDTDRLSQSASSARDDGEVSLDDSDVPF